MARGSQPHPALEPVVNDRWALLLEVCGLGIVSACAPTVVKGTIKKAEAQRLKARLARIERGESGWQGTAWALERIYPKRFSRPEIQLAQQINVDTNSPGELIVDTKRFSRAILRHK